MPKSHAKLGKLAIALDARPDRLDLRDLPYRGPIENLPPEHPPAAKIAGKLPGYLKSHLMLDQGREGACTGFGLAAAINFQLWARAGYADQHSDRVSPYMLYRLARFYDEWPGEDYEGSSCRGALKGWQKHGACAERLWQAQGPQDEAWRSDAVTRPVGIYYRIDKNSIVDMQSALHNMHAIYVSASVHSGWTKVAADGTPTHDGLPLIQHEPEPIGGHAFAIVGYNRRGFIVQNSWGTGWGASGFAILSYQDWIENGSDAWVMGLGVPIARDDARSPAFRVRAKRPAGSAPGTSWGPANDPLDLREKTWQQEEAYRHTIVTGNDGVLQNRLPQAANPADNARLVCYTWPKQALAGGNTRDLVLFLHGGLGSEASSIERIRIMGPWLSACNTYPLFVSWKSGWKEILQDIVADKAHQLFGAPPAQGLGGYLIEKWDRAVEKLTRELLVRSMWNEMKENIADGMRGDGDAGLSALALSLQKLAADVPGLRLHLIGHSAGAIISGHLLTRFTELQMKVASCTLYAPACDMAFANTHYRRAVENQTLAKERLAIHALTDRLEQDDSTGPYRKSLLYLVSRALERLHKTPLLGMQLAHDPEYNSDKYWHQDTLDQLKAWQAFYPKGSLNLLNKRQVSDGVKMIDASHGCFDNAVDIVAATIAAITGTAPDKLPPGRLDY